MPVPEPALAVLVLGGTSEGYALAEALAGRPEGPAVRPAPRAGQARSEAVVPTSRSRG